MSSVSLQDHLEGLPEESQKLAPNRFRLLQPSSVPSVAAVSKGLKRSFPGSYRAIGPADGVLPTLPRRIALLGEMLRRRLGLPRLPQE